GDCLLLCDTAGVECGVDKCCQDANDYQHYQQFDEGKSASPVAGRTSSWVHANWTGMAQFRHAKIIWPSGGVFRRTEQRLAMAERDSGFTQIVGGHLHINLVADADADEIFAHLAGNVRQDLMTTRESHTKHCTRQHLRHRASEFNWFFFSHADGLRVISCH